MLDKVDIQIMRKLINAQKPLTIKALAFETSVSEKTIQQRMKYLKERLIEKGAEIKTKQRVGSILVIHDKDKFTDFFNEQLAAIDESAIGTENLLQQVITLFMDSTEYIKLDHISEQLYVSKTKLSRVIRDLKVVLSHYDLQLKMKPHYGMKIVGREFDMRRFLASDYVQHPMEKSIIILHDMKENLTYQRLEQITHRTLEEQNYPMATQLFQNLVSHLYIAIERIGQGKTISFEQPPRGFYSSMKEKELAQKIIENVEKEFHLNVPKSEQEYLLIHILGKRVLGSESSHIIPSSINQLVADILERILETHHIDLLQDFDLRAMLALHILPLITRLEYGLEMKNPILEEVKIQCMTGFDLAIVVNEVIVERYQKQLSEDELSYFALHFDVALHRDGTNEYQKKILVVCPSGRASAELLKLKFEKHFPQYLKKIVTCDLNQCESYLKKERFDYVLTTVPLAIPVNIPVFHFDFLFNNQTVRKLETILSGQYVSREYVEYFFKRTLFLPASELKTKEAILKTLIERVKAVEEVPSQFEELVYQRESYFSTDIFKNAAIPHPNQVVSNQTFVAVMLLRSPVDWGHNKVRSVFLTSISRFESEKYTFIYDWLIRLLSRDDCLQRIIEENSYESLIDELLKVINE